MVTAGARKYYQFTDDLYVQDNLVIRGHQVVTPRKMRRKFLEKIHEGHQGIVKCSRRAREAVWWPGATKDSQQMINSCKKCLKERTIKHQPLKPTDLLDRPWEELRTGLFEFQEKLYLRIVDYYSR